MGLISNKSDQIHLRSPSIDEWRRRGERHKHSKKIKKSADRSRLSRLSAYLFGTCIWADKAHEWHQPPYQRISRSRRKGADLATGGRDLASQRSEARANGVCPVPDNNGPPACTSSAQKKAVLIPSFSQTVSAQSTRKAAHHHSLDNCVADSVDDQMLDKLCTLPKGLDRHEWLATHVLALFEHINCISATLSEVCTPISCSTMNFPGNSKAQWVDERGKRHNYCAMRYIDSVMALCEGARKNQSLFPTKYGATFAVEFEQHCARMVRLLWHCAGHAYAKHWDHLSALNLRLQFGLVLAHMAKLAKLYSLLSDKELCSLLHTVQLARPSTTTTVVAASTSDGNDSSPSPQQQQQHQSAPIGVPTALAAAFVQPSQPPQHRPTKRALLEDNNGNNDYTGTSTEVLVCRTNTSF